MNLELDHERFAVTFFASGNQHCSFCVSTRIVLSKLLIPRSSANDPWRWRCRRALCRGASVDPHGVRALGRPQAQGHVVQERQTPVGEEVPLYATAARRERPTDRGGSGQGHGQVHLQGRERRWEGRETVQARGPR